MYNYHAPLVWKIDAALLCLSLALVFAIFIYNFIKEYFESKRNRKLLEIKKELSRFALSGRKDKKVCYSIGAPFTPQQFLDIATNRRRDVVFFNEREQLLFKDCFVSHQTILAMGRIASGAGNKWRRIEAIAALGYTGKEEALPVLEKTAADKDEDVSYFSALSLGQIKTVTSAKILLDLLRARPFARRKIASILESFPPETANDIIKLTKEKDPDVRFWAIKLLSTLKPEQYRGRIEELTSDESPDVRAASCECLGKFGNKESRDVVMHGLKDDAWFVRMHAVRALSKILGKDSIPLIIGLINDGSLSVIDSVKAAMVSNIEAARPYIEKIMAGKDEFAKKICAEALSLSHDK